MRSMIAESIRAIQPYDELERQHIAATLDWIASGAPLFRIARPDRPPQHLVQKQIHGGTGPTAVRSAACRNG